MQNPESLALEVCQVKELSLSNREYFILVEYLSKQTKKRYREIMKMNPAEILQHFGFDRRSARSMNK